MARYIDADKAEERFKYIYCDDCDSRNGVRCRACDFRDGADVFSDAPTEDVQPVVHSKWEISSDGYYCYCKRCKARPPEMTKYCPECGARMDAE